jgi:hypothetical protein
MNNTSVNDFGFGSLTQDYFFAKPEEEIWGVFNGQWVDLVMVVIFYVEEDRDIVHLVNMGLILATKKTICIKSADQIHFAIFRQRGPTSFFYGYKPIGPTARKSVQGCLLYH